VDQKKVGRTRNFLKKNTGERERDFVIPWGSGAVGVYDRKHFVGKEKRRCERRARKNEKNKPSKEKD